ncbi:fimbriae stability-associated protein [Klebsiella pneumoniae]|nr:fimbriae stability-associated protein [Klebsiella pneumoniae]
MKGLPKNTIAWLLFCGSLAAPSAWGFETNYDRGRVDFAGRVTDISCSVALNGGQHAGSGNVCWRRSAWRKSTIAGPGRL